MVAADWTYSYVNTAVVGSVFAYYCGLGHRQTDEGETQHNFLCSILQVSGIGVSAPLHSPGRCQGIPHPCMTGQYVAPLPGYTRISFELNGHWGSTFRESDDADGTVVAVKYIARSRFAVHRCLLCRDRSLAV